METTRKRLAFLRKAEHGRWAGWSGKSKHPDVRAAIEADARVKEAEGKLGDALQGGGDAKHAHTQAAVAREDAAEKHKKVAESELGAVTREHYAKTSAKHQAAATTHREAAAKAPSGGGGAAGDTHSDVLRWVTVDEHPVPITEGGIAPK